MKYALITGGTSGIGFELARCFAREGCGIIIVSSSDERLQKAKRQIENEFSASVLAYREDLGKPGAAVELFNRIEMDNLDVSILVNSAGIGLVGSTEKIGIQQDESMLTMNIINLAVLSKLYIAEMYRKGDGKILNVASTGAFQPGPYTSTYFASKAFVLSYSRAIRYEAREKGVQVCILCPGSTKTEFFIREGAKTPQNAMSAEEVARYAYKRFMRNKEIIVPGLVNKIMLRIPVKLRMMAIARIKKQK